jgi:hypothetical protein
VITRRWAAGSRSTRAPESFRKMPRPVDWLASSSTVSASWGSRSTIRIGGQLALAQGLAAARARGRVGGRSTVMTPTRVEVARRMVDEGRKPGEIAQERRVGRTTVYRHLAESANT